MNVAFPLRPAGAAPSGEALPSAPPRFAMSVDVEDYFQVWAFSRVINQSDWEGYPSRVEGATRRALKLLHRKGARATFFVLGWAAERAPQLVREIAAGGHEIASHGYSHAKAFDQGPTAFREDVIRAKGVIEDACGRAVTGYRAPGFSIDARTPWAHEILAETGHRYSSSTHPIAHDHYGDPDGPRAPYEPVPGLIEAPVATCEIFGRRISCAGGGWFRAAPYALSRRLLDRAGRTLGGPAIFYFHPWEIDTGQPRISNAPLGSRVRHYLNIGGMEGKLGRLLSDYRWETVADVLGVNTPGTTA